jgi:hypothetical protein
VAVDRVQSEPLSGQFPLTGNKTEKIPGFRVEAAAIKSSISLDIQDLRPTGPIRARSEQGIID